MDLKPFDIIIFRKKTFMQTIYSAVTLNLDNHVGIVVDYNNNLYVNHFVITDFKQLISNMLFNKNGKCGKIAFTPIDAIQNDECYVYRINKKLDSKYFNKDKIEECIHLAKELNYISNIKLAVNFLCSKRIFNIDLSNRCGHTCISYILWYLKQHNLYDENYLDYDFYEKKIERFKGPLFSYKIVKGYNVGKKDLSKFNPYSLSYLFSFLHNVLYFFIFILKNRDGISIPKGQILIYLCIITAICTLSGRHSHTLFLKNGTGRRYIGVVVSYILCSIVFLEYKLQIEKQYMQFIVYSLINPRIFMTRYASWLSNDLRGNINPVDKRPYDTAFYEAIFEGLIPFLFLLFDFQWLTYRAKNLIVSVNYSISRFIIEYYKPSFLKKSIVTLGQIDAVLNLVLSYWYLTFYLDSVDIGSYLFDFSLVYLFYLDVCYRFSLNKLNITNNLGLIQFIWKTSRNRGFFNGVYYQKNKFFKIMYPLVTLYLYNTYLINEFTSLSYIFNLFSLLNIFERLVNGYVTDYLTIQIMWIKTLNLNFADIVINYCILYFLYVNKLYR